MNPLIRIALLCSALPLLVACDSFDNQSEIDALRADVDALTDKVDNQVIPNYLRKTDFDVFRRADQSPTPILHDGPLDWTALVLTPQSCAQSYLIVQMDMNFDVNHGTAVLRLLASADDPNNVPPDDPSAVDQLIEVTLPNGSVGQTMHSVWVANQGNLIYGQLVDENGNVLDLTGDGEVTALVAHMGCVDANFEPAAAAE